DLSAVVKVDGRVVMIDGSKTGEIRLTVGTHEYTVEKDNVIVRGAQAFQVTNGGRNVVNITLADQKLVPPVPQNEKKNATNDRSPDRAAAEWVLSVGGEIGIQAEGQDKWIKGGGILPGGTFVLQKIDIRNKPITGGDLARLERLQDLRS